MKVTEVSVRYKNEKDTVMAYADIVFDNAFKVCGLAVLNTQRGIFIGMPFREVKVTKAGESKRREICHPIDDSLRKEIEAAVLNEYEKELPRP